MSTPIATILVYKHRHGEDISLHASAELARSAAVRIIEDTLDELQPEARERIGKMISDAGNPVADDEIIDAWQEAQLANGMDIESIEITEDVQVQQAPPPAEPLAPHCPKCTSTAVDDIEITETYSAYHPVRGIVDGKIAVENALVTSCPSEHFDDGQSDYVATCRSCHHKGTPQSFGLGDPSEWEWV